MGWLRLASQRTAQYHRSEWLSRLNQGGALLAIGSEEKPLLLTENAERLRTMVTPPDRKCGMTTDVELTLV